ncbi:murein L,D-transpeptidase catalytic domain family protein [Olivibacter sp. XZL3]|uniref:murein L,D-transpeptidase catalytic domain family protein n=1 Tax=Olivibacter sp. XZL3 TaxID=1735116 RepID=UPI001416F6FC|nr:murein L,D-transpeptidase catalytic domain family protein [Olivibacter sp. XZL3]
MKLKKSLLVPSVIFLFLAVIISSSWRSIHPTEPVSINASEEKKAGKSHSILSSTFSSVYEHIQKYAPTLDSIVFKQAYIGYLNLREQGKTESPIITIVDLSIHSSKPRMWIIDVEQDSLLLHTFVAHGRGSGIQEAKLFSDRPNSNQSSIGFYLTGETYQGKHGRSLRLDGLDQGFNTNARARGIVLHGASYVGANILKAQDRMGVSQGCPAVAEPLKDQIIDFIKNRSVLYIYGNSAKYHSAFLNEQIATQSLMAALEPQTEDSTLLTEAGNGLL